MPQGCHTSQIVVKPSASPIGEIPLVKRTVRIGITSDFDVAAYRGIAGMNQRTKAYRAISIDRLTAKYPVARSLTSEVFPLDPINRFVRVSADRPLPSRLKDMVIDIGESLLRDHMPVVIRPAPDFGIE